MRRALFIATWILSAPLDAYAQSGGSDSAKREPVVLRRAETTRFSLVARLSDFAPAVSATDSGGECHRVAPTPMGGAILAVAFPSRAAQQMSVTLTTTADGKLVRSSELRGVPGRVQIPPGSAASVRDSLLTEARTRDRSTLVSVDFITGVVVASNRGGGIPDTTANGNLREVDQLAAWQMPVVRAERALELCRMPVLGASAPAPKAAVDVEGTLRAGLPPDSTVSLFLRLLRARRYREAAQLFELTHAEAGRTVALGLLRGMIGRKNAGVDFMAMGRAAAKLDTDAIADTTHIPGVADTAMTIGALARLPIEEFLALGARLRDAGKAVEHSHPVATATERGDTVAHVIVRRDLPTPLPPKTEAIMSLIDATQTLHLRRVDNRWLFVGPNPMMGPTDVQVSMMVPIMTGMSTALISQPEVAAHTTSSPQGGVGAAVLPNCEAVKTPLFEFQVDQPARYIDDGKISPKPMMRGDAATLIQFVVDTTGAPVDKTYRVLKSATVEFANDVLKIASSWRFEPAMKGRCKVPQLVQTPVVK